MVVKSVNDVKLSYQNEKKNVIKEAFMSILLNSQDICFCLKVFLYLWKSTLRKTRNYYDKVIYIYISLYLYTNKYFNSVTESFARNILKYIS